MWCVQVAKDLVREMYEEVCQADFQCDDLDGMFIATTEKYIIIIIIAFLLHVHAYLRMVWVVKVVVDIARLISIDFHGTPLSEYS